MSFYRIASFQKSFHVKNVQKILERNSSLSIHCFGSFQRRGNLSFSNNKFESHQKETTISWKWFVAFGLVSAIGFNGLQHAQAKQKLKEEHQDLFVPQLDSLAQVIRKHLQKNFEKVEVNVVECPNLSSSPWNLCVKGLNGNSVICDVGGVHNLHFIEGNDKVFSLEDIAETIGQPNVSFIGAGAGSPKILNMNSEYMPNSNLKTNLNNSMVARIVPSNREPVLEKYPFNEFGILANMLATQGLEGKVLEVKVSKRIGSEKSFVTAIRKALALEFDKPIGLGGTFRITKGKIKSHVMPDFCGHDLKNPQEVDEWLQFYESSAPLNCYSVLISSDPNNLDFRLEHTHFVSDHGEGGHYHYDITPQEIEYIGYFIPCGRAYRIERAFPPKHKAGLYWK